MPKAATAIPTNKQQVKGIPQGTQTLVYLTAISDALKRRGQLGRLGKQFGDKRDIYNVLGYSARPTVDDYWQYYLREDLCKRIINAPANETWRVPPEICETENPDRETEFEKAWDALAKQTKVWSRFSRADKLAGVGYYGIMLIGVPGALNASVKKTLRPGQLLYLSTFSQRNATVQEFEEDTAKDRFGKPSMYEVDLSGDVTGADQRLSKKSNKAAKVDLKPVHWSRVLHFADGLLEDEVHGTPRLECVFNRIFDLQKVVGGAAEGYWRGAYGGFALEAASDATSAFSGSEIDENIIDEFAHGYRRWLELEGYELKQIEGQDMKPKETFEVLISMIAAATSIPQRILMGSERGQLASVQDETNWKEFICQRRTEYAEPLIREFIDRLISWGILPEPAKPYEIEWPDIYTPSEKEKSETFKNWADGISKLAPAGQTELLVTPKEVRTEWLGFEAEPEEELAIDPMEITARAQPEDQAQE